MKTGTDARNGRTLTGIAHVRQSLIKILTTRIGTRVMRRDFGSDIPNLIDRPVNDDLSVDLYIACAESIGRWEPRLRLRQASFRALGDGGVEFSFEADYLPGGEVVSLEGIVVR